MVENLYGSKSEYYDTIYKDKKYKEESEFLIQKLPDYGDQDSGKVLVVGCGTGNHSKHLTDQGLEVVGVDPFEGMLEVAREKSSAEFKKDSLPELHSIDGEFDLIFLPYTVINHIDQEDLEQSLNRLKELMSDNGVLVFDNLTLPDKESYDPWLEIKSDQDIELSRHVQIVRVDENKVDWRSEITVSNGDFFIDRHEIYTHSDVEIAELLQNTGFKFEIYQEGYGTESVKDDGTVFKAELT